ncbi:MAG: universal stress protein [Flavobacteriaceae bacterium]
MTQPPFKTLLIGFAFSPNLKANVYEAMRLACFFKARLLFLHVGEKTPQKEKAFSALLAQCPDRPQSISVFWESGAPVPVLLNACKTHKVDLLLLGALKRENVLKYYLGSIARKLTQNASCSVLLMLHPAVERVPCEHIVVNGLENSETINTIEKGFYVAHVLAAKKITLVEEIKDSDVAVAVSDDRSLRRATLKKQKLQRKEQLRVSDIVARLPDDLKEGVQWQTQSIFGKQGYSISHYARLVRADLLITNNPLKKGLFSRLFSNDLGHVLMELPTNVLIVNQTSYA